MLFVDYLRYLNIKESYLFIDFLNSFFYWKSIKIQKQSFNVIRILDSSSRRCVILPFSKFIQYYEICSMA
jgi:hypothetical protein